MPLPPTEREKYLRKLMQQVRDVEQATQAVHDQLLSLRPHQITDEIIADWQAQISDWYDSQRRVAKLLLEIGEAMLKEPQFNPLELFIGHKLPPGDTLKVPLDD